MVQIPAAHDTVVAQNEIVLFHDTEIGKVYAPKPPHKDRAFGGHLIVRPRRAKVHCSMDLMLKDPLGWRRYHNLIAVVEYVMLDSLPCLNGTQGDRRYGAIDISTAHDWILHPDNPKSDKSHKEGRNRPLITHLYGRSPMEPCATETEKRLHWGWGEMPQLPRYCDSVYRPARPGEAKAIPEPFNSEERLLLRTRIIEELKRLNILA